MNLGYQPWVTHSFTPWDILLCPWVGSFFKLLPFITLKHILGRLSSDGVLSLSCSESMTHIEVMVCFSISNQSLLSCDLSLTLKGIWNSFVPGSHSSRVLCMWPCPHFQLQFLWVSIITTFSTPIKQWHRDSLIPMFLSNGWQGDITGSHMLLYSLLKPPLCSSRFWFLSVTHYEEEGPKPWGLNTLMSLSLVSIGNY